jgi:quercetin dioxygenase-like cupin family protein
MERLLSDPTAPRPVTSIEGVPTSGTFFVKPMLAGDCLAMLQIRMARGVKSGMHAHPHESILYVVSGRLRAVVAGEALIVEAGQACRQPQNVAHSVEALEDTVFIEVKAPLPDLMRTLGLPNGSAAA